MKFEVRENPHPTDTKNKYWGCWNNDMETFQSVPYFNHTTRDSNEDTVKEICDQLNQKHKRS